ncbi:MAG TPA: TonB family protein [Pyrinomonadaceae bacterium]|nr:TonB family protein [Pyrinomonadaceae bacterium]
MSRSRSPQFFSVHCRVFLALVFLLITSVVAFSQAPAGPAPTAPTNAAKTSDTEKPAAGAASLSVGAAPSSIGVAKPATQPEQLVVEAEKPPADPDRSAEALQVRIERARALIAAHRLDIAASELESVRAAARDNALRNITSIMLMNVYLEEGNYGRSEALLEESFKARSAQKDESLGIFFALAGQAVNGARTHLARYRTFGVNLTGSNLPPEVVSDLDRLRSLLERMVAQAQEISTARRAYDSLSLLEDVLGLRLLLAKDSEDQSKWETEYAGARESLASSQTQIASLGGIPLLRPGKTPGKNTAPPSPYSTKKVSEPLGVKAPDKDHVTAERPSASDSVATSQATAETAEDAQVTEAGSLNARATRKVLPRYPAIAKQNGATGLVRVHVIVDEAGRVVAISRTEGPMLLRGAAEEAARQWSFEASPGDDRPRRLSGYIDFTFTL